MIRSHLDLTGDFTTLSNKGGRKIQARLKYVVGRAQYVRIKIFNMGNIYYLNMMFTEFDNHLQNKTLEGAI
jgi:hypothetical protein